MCIWFPRNLVKMQLLMQQVRAGLRNRVSNKLLGDADGAVCGPHGELAKPECFNDCVHFTVEIVTI